MSRKQVTGSISKTVFTDVLLLLLGAILGLQSTMSMDEKKARNLPPVKLVETKSPSQSQGTASDSFPIVTVKKSKGEFQYFFNEKQMVYTTINSILKKTHPSRVLIRVDAESLPEIAGFIKWYGKLKNIGVRQISYVIKKGGS